MKPRDSSHPKQGEEQPMQPITKPNDFQEYWQAVLRIVDDYAPDVSITRWENEDPHYEGEYIIDRRTVPEVSNPEDINPFDFRWWDHTILTGLTVQKLLFPSFDGHEVGGLLQYPRSSSTRKLPTIVHFTGYGGELMVDADFVSAGYAVLNFSHRGMYLGRKNFDRYTPVPLLVRDIEDKERYVYRSIVIDCLLAIKALSSLEFVDPRRIAVMGMSQGAGLSVMTAALNPRIKALAADVPWLTHFAYQLSHDVEGPYNEIKEFCRRFPEKEAAALETLGYFDTLSFADRLDQPVLMSLGLEDSVCPPPSVRTLFQAIHAIKALLEIPGMGHERSTIWRYLTQKWFDFYV
ncbi:prolyl oligopeptidase family serine peptidase [candidate division KSB3 bacterium]|uniref:Prolyl oligopeptidase family serine peptidase n=1 Tax=candidate division KSB3 bacterium TaxID=2044937 RepID=A0A9D5Q4J2_9BACT|nr:prolyl oligopeptidase family serine peptidase [candidate division KSB3 bacterium]MBD3323774.1 prolyl oligopeptidase family serine peptidase [candidate division KSB3 bacterium]